MSELVWVSKVWKTLEYTGVTGIDASWLLRSIPFLNVIFAWPSEFNNTDRVRAFHKADAGEYNNFETKSTLNHDLRHDLFCPLLKRVVTEDYV